MKPYQPEGYWENLNFPARQYVADAGRSQYRRGLYTWWQRSFLHPSLLAFDAPSREECCAERNRSNIPQQALVLLNDPTYVEAARVLAARILSEGGSADRGAAELGLAARAATQSASRRGDHDQRIAGPASGRSIGRIPRPRPRCSRSATPRSPTRWITAELAAWTHVARVLLNLHETITRM